VVHVREYGVLDAQSLLIIDIEEFLGPSGGVWKSGQYGDFMQLDGSDAH